MALIVLLLTIGFLYGAEVFVLLRAMFAIARHRPARRALLSKPAVVLHVLAAGGLACLGYARFIEPTWIDVSMMTIHTPKLKEASIRIVQISDLHCDTKPRNEERLVTIVNDLKPDIVVATGDYLNDASALPLLKSTLSRLEAPLGAFAVTGNFEVDQWSHLDLFTETGFELLAQNTTTLMKGPDMISITGLAFDRGGAYRSLLAGFPTDRFHVFLHHWSDLVEDVDDFGVDLYLCGHTHGGQIAVPLYGAVITFSRFGKKYESGMYRVGDTTLYVNRGLGLEPRPAPQMRFFARPEIAVFDIVPAQR
jgi:predicted MPP superfamily phosphohydrolase